MTCFTLTYNVILVSKVPLQTELWYEYFMLLYFEINCQSKGFRVSRSRCLFIYMTGLFCYRFSFIPHAVYGRLLKGWGRNDEEPPEGISSVTHVSVWCTAAAPLKSLLFTSTTVLDGLCPLNSHSSSSCQRCACRYWTAFSRDKREVVSLLIYSIIIHT